MSGGLPPRGEGLGDASSPSVEIRAKVREFLVENFMFRGDIAAIPDDGSLLKAGILDSVGILLLVTFIEETYETKVDDDEVDPDNLESVDNITAFILRKKG